MNNNIYGSLWQRSAHNDSLRAKWEYEQSFAFSGWDFSHLRGRWESDEPSWDYEAVVRSHLKPDDYLLDQGSGGGEFILSLLHPHRLTAVTESYPPNAALCREKLAPLGITVAETDDDSIPFPDESFDIVTNRHESYDPQEVFRTLASGGLFITQQVGGENNNELSRRLIKGFTPPYPEQTLKIARAKLEQTGFTILAASECYPKLRFFDIGALVYFCKIIEWEFPGFSVEKCYDTLCSLQKELEKDGYIESVEHRFLLVAKKTKQRGLQS